MCSAKLEENIDMLRCPICHSSMGLDSSAANNTRSLKCMNNHCFDLSKSGYANLLLRPVKSDYDKAMLKSRSLILKDGFFLPVIEKISEIITNELSGKSSYDRKLSKKNIRILDVGCGEGTLLAQTIDSLNSSGYATAIDAGVSVDSDANAGVNVNAGVNANVGVDVGVGIDISKEGIQLASKSYPDCFWYVADLTRSPFADSKFDVILNILSPSNYDEFRRIMADGGLLIKAVPGSSYLKELRELLYHETEKESYSNEKVINHFKDNFNLIDTCDIKYERPLTTESLEQLIYMTPLSWSAGEDKIQEVLASGLKSITVDMTIIYGMNKAASNE